MHERSTAHSRKPATLVPATRSIVLVGDGFADQWENMKLLDVDDDGGFRQWENPAVRDALRVITLSAGWQAVG